MLGYRSIKNAEKIIYTAKKRIEYAEKLLKECDPLTARAQKIACEASFEAVKGIKAVERCRKYLYRITKNKWFKPYKKNYEFHLNDLYEDLSYIRESDRPFVRVNTAAFHIEYYCNCHITGYKEKFYKLQNEGGKPA